VRGCDFVVQLAGSFISLEENVALFFDHAPLDLKDVIETTNALKGAGIKTAVLRIKYIGAAILQGWDNCYFLYLNLAHQMHVACTEDFLFIYLVKISLF
jgi:hypothetical protein